MFSRTVRWSLPLCLFALSGCAPAPAPSGGAKPSVPQAPAAAKPAAQNEPGPDDAGAADQEFTATASGLKYRILRASEGRKPTAADAVLCHYRGWLDDGSEFDSSYKGGEPISFPLSGVIRGWTEGLQFVAEGGKIELEIPAELAYGAEGRPGIPPNATLHFVVELIKVL